MPDTNLASERSLAAHWAKIKAENQARRERAAALAASGRPVPMSKPDGRKALVQADMSEPGMFRMTRFDEAGPIGHTQYGRLAEAVYDALLQGYEPIPTDLNRNIYERARHISRVFQCRVAIVRNENDGPGVHWEAIAEAASGGFPSASGFQIHDIVDARAA